MSSLSSLPPNTKHPIPFLTAQKLPYLQAIISETLRMYSPVGMPLSRVIPSSGATVLSHHLPGGTWIMMPQWCIGRSKSIWGEDADVFRPERWLQQESESADQFTERLESWRKNDITWGKGDVTCVGKNIAMMEIYKVAVEVSLFPSNPIFLGVMSTASPRV
jgi:cytochrome P450